MFARLFSPDRSGKPFAGLEQFFLAKKSDFMKLFFWFRKTLQDKKACNG
jgi:hypothetical protein